MLGHIAPSLQSCAGHSHDRRLTPDQSPLGPLSTARCLTTRFFPSLTTTLLDSFAAMATYTHDFKTEVFTGKVEIPLQLFINNEWVNSADSSAGTIEIINPTTGKAITKIVEGREADVDIAVKAATKTFETTWGDNVPGFERGKLLMKLATLIERDVEILAAIEALDNGKTFSMAKAFDVTEAAATFRYYGGWADKTHGKVIETHPGKLGFTRHEPIGVVGQIIPWNFPLLMFAWKIAPALATGCTVVIKPSELTPLSALYTCNLIKEAGFPAGCVNVVTGYGQTVGNHISSHHDISKVAFTGSTAVGRKVMEQAAKSNIKNITLELGGKGAAIYFDDSDVDASVRWAAWGIFFNHGQTCCAGSRIFVQKKIYKEFTEKFAEYAKNIKVGDPFSKDTFQGAQVSQTQYDRIMNYVECGKAEGAKCISGGERHGTDGYFIQPTIFMDVEDNMTIAKEEVFGPLVCVTPFDTEEEAIKMANDTVYGLANAVFSQNITRAHRVANKLKSGTVWVNCYNQLHPQIPFGGYKQSGIGRELGEYALENYTAIKAVHVNLGGAPPLP